MKRLPLSLLLCVSAFFISCSRDRDPVVLPANVLMSDTGLIIELEWRTGGSINQALYDTDLDLYLDLGSRSVEVSDNINSFERVQLRDFYKDGTYDVIIGAIDVRRRTNYDLYISSPDGGPIHRYSGFFLAGEVGEIRYLSIRKLGSRYTLLNL